jgi:tetratricopeptide (TPR) repeat protein
MRGHLLKTIAVVFLSTTFYVIPGPAFGQSNEEAISDRAWDLFDNEEYEACLKELKMLSLENEEPGAGPYYLLGLCQYELEDFEASIESFGMSLQKDPKMIENYFYRGYAYWANSQYKEAAADFEMSLKKNKGKNKGDKSFTDHLAANYAYCLGKSGGEEKALTYLEKYWNINEDLFHVLAYFTSAARPHS